MASPEDPLLTFHFALEVSGVISGLFTHVGGLGSENEVIEHKVVAQGAKEAVQVLPGRLKWTPITLKRGITSSLDIWDWRQKVVEGKITDARKAASIIAYSTDGTAMAKWDLTNAWPSKVTGPEFDSASGNIMFEEVTLVFEGVKRVKP
jgi:phage tail-like protein